MNLDLSMLEGLEVMPILTETKTKTRVNNKQVEKGDFKITKSGCMYLSESFEQELTTEKGLNWMDFADGNKMNFSGKTVPFLFINVVPVGTPRASVQGIGKNNKPAFVESLKEMVTDIYGIDWEVENSVEFTLLRDKGIIAKKGYVPRVVVKGKDKGEMSYETRDNAFFIPVIPVSMLPKPVTTPVVEQLTIDFATTDVVESVEA